MIETSISITERVPVNISSVNPSSEDKDSTGGTLAPAPADLEPVPAPVPAPPPPGLVGPESEDSLRFWDSDSAE